MLQNNHNQTASLAEVLDKLFVVDIMFQKSKAGRVLGTLYNKKSDGELMQY